MAVEVMAAAILATAPDITAAMTAVGMGMAATVGMAGMAAGTEVVMAGAMEAEATAEGATSPKNPALNPRAPIVLLPC